MIGVEDKDVYETEDLPEADQNLQTSSEDKNIDKIDVSYESARSNFKKNVVETSNADFSDCVKPYFNKGYVIESNEYVMHPEGDREFETPIQKFQRLQCELKELSSDLDIIKAASQLKIENLEPAKNILDKERNLEQIIDDIRSIELQNILGVRNSSKLEIDDETCGFETREMFENIKKYVANHKSNSKSGDKMSWERYYKSPLTKEMENAKVADLDQRILKLESALGYSDRTSSTSALTGSISTMSLVDATKMLTGRCQSLKGGPNVDKLETRLMNLQNKLQLITEKGDLIKEADRQNKVAELFNLVGKWKTFQYDVAFITKRLNDLNTLHEQAMLFPETLSFIEKGQKEIKQEYIQYSENLNKVSKNFLDSVGNIESNIVAMQEKINKVK